MSSKAINQSFIHHQDFNFRLIRFRRFFSIALTALEYILRVHLIFYKVLIHVLKSEEMKIKFFVVPKCVISSLSPNMASSGTKNGSVYFRCYLSSFVRKPIVCIALEVKSQKSKVIAIGGFKDQKKITCNITSIF